MVSRVGDIFSSLSRDQGTLVPVFLRGEREPQTSTFPHSGIGDVARAAPVSDSALGFLVPQAVGFDT